MAHPVTTADKEPKPRDQSRTKNRKRKESRAATLGEADAYSVEEFCRKHRIGVATFYKYPDEMPDTFYVGTHRLISREARARWIAAREAAAKKAASKAETAAS
jgi:hypothetical protein